MNYEPQDLITELARQRNRLADAEAQYLAALVLKDRQIAELEKLVEQLEAQALGVEENSDAMAMEAQADGARADQEAAP